MLILVTVSVVDCCFQIRIKEHLEQFYIDACTNCAVLVLRLQRLIRKMPSLVFAVERAFRFKLNYLIPVCQKFPHK